MNPTPSVSEDQLAAANYFLNFPGDTDSYQEKIQNLLNAPRKLSDFQVRFRTFLNKILSAHPVGDSICSPGPATITERIIKKESILNKINLFEDKQCKVIKICFGFDACLNLQLIVSGTYHSPGGQFSPSEVDNYLGKKPVAKGQPNSIFYLNFGSRISAVRASEMLSRFEKIQTEPVPWATDPIPLFGYLLDIDTFRLFLEDEQYLGKAKKIRIRFGINNDGTDPSLSGRPKIMMLEFSGVGREDLRPFYMCNMSTKQDSDPGDCPPRDPCNLSA